jgi:bifunctional non-homologous end joining protein LigD
MRTSAPPARDRRSPAGFFRPLQPTIAREIPSGEGWSYELKHDGYRVLGRLEAGAPQLWTRYGRGRTSDFVAIADALRDLRVPVAIDGEAVAHDGKGLPNFHLLASAAGARDACLYVFDLLELDGENLRPLPLEARRARLRQVLAGAGPALIFSETIEGPGDVMFRKACELGLEGVVAKHLASPYIPGRRRYWQKLLNPDYRRPSA